MQKKSEETCMMYANTCKDMHYASRNMHKHATYMLKICNPSHIQVIRAYLHFCICIMIYVYAHPHMQLDAYNMHT